MSNKKIILQNKKIIYICNEKYTFKNLNEKNVYSDFAGQGSRA